MAELLVVDYSDGTGENDLVLNYSEGEGVDDLVLSYSTTPITTLAYGRVTITGSDKLPVEVST